MGWVDVAVVCFLRRGRFAVVVFSITWMLICFRELGDLVVGLSLWIDLM